MRDLLGEVRQRLTSEIDLVSAFTCEPIGADPWIVSSLLQKSIRRGETELAQRAALTLFKMRGSAIWRRFMVIVFEDVGVGSVDAVTRVVAAGSDAAFRRARGGDARIAAHLAGVLAEAPKDRSADYLVGAKDHPALAAFGKAMANASIETKLSSVRDKTLTLPQRAAAVLFASGPHVEFAWSKIEPDGPLRCYRELGVPEDLLVATEIAAARTQEPITIMVPLIWLAAKESPQAGVRECAVPPLTIGHGVPLYALDMHTRLGREAIWRFACENDQVRSCIERFVPASRRRRAANVAAFYVDGAPVARRLLWDQSSSLEAFGIERDLMHAGVLADGIGPLLECMRANLDHLNKLRTDILVRSQSRQVSNAANRADVQ